MPALALPGDIAGSERNNRVLNLGPVDVAAVEISTWPVRTAALGGMNVSYVQHNPRIEVRIVDALWGDPYGGIL